ncbi:MAG: hypothetical protein ACYTDU_04510 [Planctomycetota bacterium]|jgi:hypothetical protein
MQRFLFLAALALAACGPTTKEVRSGEALKDARPADYKATKEEVLKLVDSFLTDRDFKVEYNADKSMIKAYRKGDDALEQNIEMAVKVEPGPAEGLTRVTAASGRSLGAVSRNRQMAERLQDNLRANFKDR